MGTPATSPTAAPEEKRRRVSKYFERVKSVLKGSESTKRNSLVPAAASSAVASSSTPGVTTTEDPPRPEPTALATDPPPPVNPDLEKARRLAAKYGVELQLQDWKLPVAGQRVEKAIRMRIHRTCHLCNTTFGASKTCVTCHHARCNECPRYPKKKTPGERRRGKSGFVAAAAPGTGGVAFGESAAETIEGVKKRRDRPVLSIPSKTGGQDLVHKKPMQRVRRTCHQCKTLYIPPNKTCAGCAHVRCSECPRDPPKRERYPSGYPGDDGVDASRAKKVQVEPDPETAKRVDERVFGLRLDWERPPGPGAVGGPGTGPPPA